MITDFMNDAAARGQEVYCNNKGANRNWPDGVGCLEKDNLKLKVIGPKWQSCTTFGTSFGYLEGDPYKTIEGVIHEMIEVISRNGNFLINIGPKADGTGSRAGRASAGDGRLAEDQRRGHLWHPLLEGERAGERTTGVHDQGEDALRDKLAKPSAPFTIEATAGWQAAE